MYWRPFRLDFFYFLCCFLCPRRQSKGSNRTWGGRQQNQYWEWLTQTSSCIPGFWAGFFEAWLVRDGTSTFHTYKSGWTFITHLAQTLLLSFCHRLHGLCRDPKLAQVEFSMIEIDGILWWSYFVLHKNVTTASHCFVILGKGIHQQFPAHEQRRTEILVTRDWERRQRFHWYLKEGCFGRRMTCCSPSSRSLRFCLSLICWNLCFWLCFVIFCDHVHDWSDMRPVLNQAWVACHYERRLKRRGPFSRDLIQAKLSWAA